MPEEKKEVSVIVPIAVGGISIVTGYFLGVKGIFKNITLKKAKKIKK